MTEVATHGDQELDHLVEMSNDIARNFSFHADGVDRIADHMTRFWAPILRRRIIEYVDAGGAGLSDSAIAAVKKLQKP